MKRRNTTKKMLIMLMLCLGSTIVYTKVPPGEYQLNAKADDQRKGSHLDTETTRKLRLELMSDKELSTYAHNINIVTLGNNITLTGRVKNKIEMNRIEEMVKKYSPDKKIINNLTYKTSQY